MIRSFAYAILFILCFFHAGVNHNPSEKYTNRTISGNYYDYFSQKSVV